MHTFLQEFVIFIATYIFLKELRLYVEKKLVNKNENTHSYLLATAYIEEENEEALNKYSKIF